MSKHDGGPAYPQYDYGNAGKGMTMRDWFAGQALQGMLSNPSVTAEIEMASEGFKGDLDASAVAQSQMNVVSRICYRVADAMLKAREE